ncbi:MAG: hypothetical protein ACJAW3_001439 [Lentimonas sp.]|jgi:hypothetical protein
MTPLLVREIKSSTISNEAILRGYQTELGVIKSEVKARNLAGNQAGRNSWGQASSINH